MHQTSHLSASRELDRLFKKSLDRLLYCPSCTTQRLSLSRSRLRSTANTPQRRRHTSTLTSSTAINGTKPIPPRFRPLYSALTEVRKKAPAQVNLSRLQLALQGLESESPPTRVAVLGLNVPDTARRIVRLLLVDALEPAGSWEEQLASGDQEYSHGLLIRYGHPPNSSLPQSRTSIATLHILSPVLQRNNVEILVSSINADSPDVSTNASTSPDAFLSPVVGTPTSASGRQVLISQPVHKTLVIAKGLDELVSVSWILASTKFSSALDKSMISVAVDLPNTPASPDTKTAITDVEKAEQGLAAIRRSLSEATIYEKNWNASGLPTLSSWLHTATSPSTKMSLISSLLASTSANLHSQALVSAVTASRSSLPNASRSSLDDAITTFSRSAHTELQSGLSSAWSSRNWRKLAWWKLFWRVDDVGLIISDLVTNSWLVNTEKGVYELSGRLKQVDIEPVDVADYLPAGMVEVQPVKEAPIMPTIPPEVPYPEERQTSPVFVTAPAVHVVPMTSSSPVRAFASENIAPARPVLTSSDGQHVELRMETPPQPIALSILISSIRNKTMAEYIASLTITAQQLVLQTLSISGFSAGLSGLLYFSITAGSIYEAGTVVALGTVYALRRMQTDWQASCRSLEEGLMEEGRGIIKRIEGRMKTLVEEGGMTLVDPVEVQTRLDAEEAVARARLELRKLMETDDAEEEDAKP